MVEKFHEELEDLKKDVLKMGQLATKMLKISIEGLKNQDLKKAEWVNTQKTKIAEMDEKNEEKAMRLIALYQPMAKDMRTIACCLKMITYLARIGRYAKDIANVAIEIAPDKPVAKLISIPYMNDLVCDMISDTLNSFKKEDLSLIKNLSDRDDDIDSLRYSIFRECLTYMMEDPKKINRCAHYMMIARYLERCADHACKMAEKINYMITGKRVEIK
ncbi:MAG TPA: phosphate signaling complex protein PhoU [Desulfobacterales bacterium]|nr:phosphate signaling complex protein PhoU [Desulfobacterales bacterium]